MSENSTHFSLASSSPIFTSGIIERIGKIAESKEIEDLICNNASFTTLNNKINSFLRLMYQPDPFPINTCISCER